MDRKPLLKQFDRVPTIIEACGNKEIFGHWFKDHKTYRSWFTFFKSIFALPMDDKERELFYKCTGRSKPPKERIKECWLIVGRRGGKSLAIAVLADYLAVFCDWRSYVVPGEVPMILVLATDRRQAGVIFNYAKSLFLTNPRFRPLLKKYTAEKLELKNGVTIRVTTSSYRTVRGFTVVAALLDELAFWRNEESANPDEEIVNALRPAMATIPNSLLIGGSSPYSRKGFLYDQWKRWFGVNSDHILVWRADTKTMNPTISQKFLDAQYESDPVSAATEYGAEFRSDVDSFVLKEVLDKVIPRGTYERAYSMENNYFAFVDPSGGSSDSFTLAISHYDQMMEIPVLDLIREIKPPFDPEVVVKQFCALCRQYEIYGVVGDRYGGELVSSLFSKCDMNYNVCEQTKSDLYIRFVTLLNSGTCELLDNAKMEAQLLGLERKASRARDIVDHPPRAHDDIANAVAGAIVLGNRHSVWNSKDVFLGDTMSSHQHYRGDLGSSADDYGDDDEDPFVRSNTLGGFR